MIINLKTKKIQINGDEHLLKIRLILGWHMPNLSLVMPNLTVNYTFYECLFQLMNSYSDLDIECDNVKRDKQELLKELKEYRTK